MKKDTGKSIKQLLAEVEELRRISSEQEEKLNVSNQQLDAHNQQLEAKNQQLIASEKSLRESEEKYRTLIDDVLNTSAAGIFILSKDFKVIWINNSIEKFFGLKRDNVIGQDNKQLIQSKVKNIFEDPETFRKKVFAAYDNNTYIENFDCHVLPDGDRKERWIEHWSQPIQTGLYKGGRIEHYSDITEHKLAEDKVKENEAMLSAAMDNSQAGIAIADVPSGKLIYVNKAGLLIRDKDYDEIAQNVDINNYVSVWQIMHFDGTPYKPEDVPLARAVLYGETVKEEFVIRRDDQQDRIVLAHAAPVNNAEGERIAAIVVFLDITERKEAEQGLKNLHELFKKTEVIGKIGGWEFDVKTMTQTWTEEIFQLMEIETTHGEPKVARGIGFIDQPFRDSAEKAIQEAIQKGKGYDQEWRITTAKGNKRWVHAVASANMKNGEVVSVSGSFQDISDRKQAEDKLKKSEERYRSLVDTVNSGVAIYKVINDGSSGSDYIIQDFNLFALKHEKMKKEDVIGKSLKKIRPNIDKYGLIDVFRKVWKTGESTYFPAKVYIDENYSNYYENRVFKLPSGEIVAVYDDVTERETARLELASNEQKLKNIIENSTNLFYSHSVDEKITFISPQVKEILGYDPKEVFTHWTEFITDNPMNEKASEYTKKALKTGQRQPTYELEMLRKDGEKIVVEVREAPIIENGEVVSLVGSLADITKRKKDEKQMRFLSAITENMHDSIVVTDLQGNITYINKRAENLYGYTLDELAGKNHDFINIDSRAKEIQAEMYETVSKGAVYQGEALNRRKDGSEFICEFTVAPMADENGVVSSYLGIQRDITEIRNLENAAIRQERLSAIGELASGVAHDFNNALQIIMGGVEMAMMSEEPEELKQYLESIKHSAGDAASRVRQLQRFSQKSQAQKENVPININNFVEDVIKETKLSLNQFQEKGIHFDIESGYKAKSNIAGDEGELRACLFNLIKNSTEAMPEGGKITISTDEYDDKVYVSVSDTGTGMDKETEKKIFQPFYSTKGFEPGRGLGMAQVYSAIRDHNGDIYIKESVIGKGTVIEFAIPVSKKKFVLEKKEKDHVGTARILLVDDEEMICSLGQKMLEKLGHTADIAANGKEALEFLARGNTYDLVITDIGMPGMSGWQLAEQIKDKGYITRIAVVTGWGTEVSEEEKKRYNVGYVLGKPIKLKDLKALIGEVLQMKTIQEK